MTLEERIRNDLVKAMKEEDVTRRTILRFILAGIKNAEKAQQKAQDDAAVIDVLTKEVKRHRESIEAFEKGNRNDLVEKEKAELAIINEYLPEQISRDEIIAAAKRAIEEVNATGPRDKGTVMSSLMPHMKGRADGKEVNEIVTELLNAL
jgi:uncharacterized protein YqeY